MSSSSSNIPIYKNIIASGGSCNDLACKSCPYRKDMVEEKTYLVSDCAKAKVLAWAKKRMRFEIIKKLCE
jgi:hypothetical protein